MKKKIFLIISSVVFCMLFGFSIICLIVSKNISLWNVDEIQSGTRNSALFMNDSILATSENIEGSSNIIVWDQNGNRLWKKGMPSSISMIETFDEMLFVSSNRQVFIFNKKGDVLSTLQVDFDAVDMVYDKEQGVAAIVTRYKVNDNVIYYYNVNSEGLLELINDEEVTKVITQISLGSNKEFYVGTGTQVFMSKRGISGYKLNSKCEFTSNSAFNGMVFKNNKFYLSDNNGNIEIFAKNEGGYLFEKNINYGSGNSKIAINDEGNILVVDYLGKAMVYSTSNEKVVTTFTTSTSSTSHEINNVGDIVVVVSLSSVNIYNTDTLPFVSFVGKIKVILIILDVLSLIVLCLAILSNFEKTRNKLVKVGKLIYRDKVVYLYLLPVFAGLILFTYYPIAWGITLAFENYTPGIRQDFVGFDNFKELFSNIEFWISFKNMGIFLITDIFKAIVPPIIAAEAMHALISKRTQYWARFVMYIPGILPGVAAMLLWKDGIFGYDGVISQIFGLFGVDNLSQYAWLGNASTAKWALIFIGFPWVGQYLIYYGALSSIPESIYEAAELDGFSWARRIISIDIPMIGAQIKYILVTTFIGSIQNFSRVYLTTNGAFDTNIPALELYTNITKHQNYGAAATMGLILFLIIFGISFRQLKGNMRED